MRLNKYIAGATGLSRRAADTAIAEGRVLVDGQPAQTGTMVNETTKVELDGQLLTLQQLQTIILNKPPGYVCSRDGQGSKTIYDLLPPALHHLKPVGRLDKYSSGLLLLTNDGELANQLTHPRYDKIKIYEVKLHKELTPEDFEKITKQGVQLDDGPSKLGLQAMNSQSFEWQVTMTEGRNRQIRRTFEPLGYQVVRLHRTHFGPYTLGTLKKGSCKNI